MRVEKKDVFLAWRKMHDASLVAQRQPYFLYSARLKTDIMIFVTN